MGQVRFLTPYARRERPQPLFRRGGVDLYDGGFTEPAGQGEPGNMIPWDKLADFFRANIANIN